MSLATHACTGRNNKVYRRNDNATTIQWEISTIRSQIFYGYCLYQATKFIDGSDMKKLLISCRYFMRFWEQCRIALFKFGSSFATKSRKIFSFANTKKKSTCKIKFA